jgi:gamma-butyrobetaine dioxygenase
MKSVQRSGRLLISEVTTSRCTSRYVTRYSPHSHQRALHQEHQHVAAESRKAASHTIRNQNVVFEDHSKASTFELPAAGLPTNRRPDLLEKYPDLDLEFVVAGEPPYFHPAYLRDACPCPRCRDPSSTQKTFQTTDIPHNIRASSVEEVENGALKITWENDLPGFGADHVSIFPKKFFDVNRNRMSQRMDRSNHHQIYNWNKYTIKSKLQYVNYDQYMTDDNVLAQAQLQLQKVGLLIVRGVPESETAVENLTGRIGPIRDSFYGRTWDVKSVPQAKNVAYTDQNLGLHMDLLYMKNPPGFQFLHCLKNSCEGGESIFVDSFNAARQVSDATFAQLCNNMLSYDYRNAGEHYFHEHPVFEVGLASKPGYRPSLSCINYSPPFQASTHFAQRQQGRYTKTLSALRRFAERVEHPTNLLEYKLQPGECVIFNNRRILHGRRQFEATEGERWLKGAYVDTDVFMSRFRVMMEKFGPHGTSINTEPQYVFPEIAAEAYQKREAKRRASYE